MEHLNDWLLEAEMAELRSPPPNVSAHLETCAQCRRAHEQVLAGYDALNAGLNELQPERRQQWAWVSVPLAAAAIIVLLLMPRQQTPKPPTMLAQLMFRPQSVVTPTNGKQAVVMEHDGMTVIWLTNRQGQQ